MPTSKSSTWIDERYRQLIRQLTDAEDYRSLLVEVLAAIHRDGGQYTQFVGIVTSVEDALNRLTAQRMERNDLLRELKKHD
jgi:FPC/CPF motif-containing protein YcgG